MNSYDVRTAKTRVLANTCANLLAEGAVDGELLGRIVIRVAEGEYPTRSDYRRKFVWEVNERTREVLRELLDEDTLLLIEEKMGAPL